MKTDKIVKAMQQSATVKGFQIVSYEIRGKHVDFNLCCVGHAEQQAKVLRACSMNVQQDGAFLSVRYSTAAELRKMQ